MSDAPSDAPIAAPEEPPAPALPEPAAPDEGEPEAVLDPAAGRSLEELESVLLRIPGLTNLVRDVRELRSLLVERRLPRVAVLGRRGAGKSSLANALLGAEVLRVGAVEDTTVEPGWVTLAHRGRRLRWLDTPGLRAGAAEDRREVLRRALAAEPPDVVLLVTRATQVDSGVDEDVAEVRWVLDRSKAHGRAAPPVVAVVSRVDELPPLTARNPPFPASKRAAIDRACGVLRGHCERLGLAPRAVVPVGAYQRFFADGAPAVDWRWNLDALADAVFDPLPPAAQAEAARAIEAGRLLRRRVALRIVHAATSLAFFVGSTPVPVADLALLAPLQSLMVTGVMYVAGRPASARAVGEWLAALGVNVGTGFALRELARGLLKLMPGFGGALSGAVAATGTWALGSSAVRYFVEGATVDEARKAYERARAEGAPSESSARDAGGAVSSAAKDPGAGDAASPTEPR